MRKQHIKLAYKIAKRSTHQCHMMAALIIRGGSVLSYATNLRGTSNSPFRPAVAYGHAERRAIMPHHDYTGATLIVVRVHEGCSRPCPDCYAAIKEAGIKKIGYVNENRDFVMERVE